MATNGVTFHSEVDYMRSATNLKDKIQKVDQIIHGLLEAAAAAASNQDISSYSVDDGQTSINTTYRSAEEARKAATEFEKLKDEYIARYNKTVQGRQIRLLDERNFRRWT